jgi:hypothetical protein
VRHGWRPHGCREWDAACSPLSTVLGVSATQAVDDVLGLGGPNKSQVLVPDDDCGELGLLHEENPALHSSASPPSTSGDAVDAIAGMRQMSYIERARHEIALARVPTPLRIRLRRKLSRGRASARLRRGDLIGTADVEGEKRPVVACCRRRSVRGREGASCAYPASLVADPSTRAPAGRYSVVRSTGGRRGRKAKNSSS